MSGPRRVLSAGTMGGTPVDTYLAATGAAGFEGASLRPAAVRAWIGERPGRTPATVRDLIADAGLVLAEIDPVLRWATPVADASGPAAGVLAVLDLAAELGADAVVALVEPEATWQEPAGIERFGRLCDAAAERGLRVQLEFFAWSPLATLAAARRVVEASGRPGAGLVLDTWHHARRGGTAADLWDLDPSVVLSVQVSDAPARPRVADLAEDCMAHRRWPGEGELDPAAVVDALVARGWDGWLGMEVFGDASGDPVARARRAMAAYDALDPPSW